MPGIAVCLLQTGVGELEVRTTLMNASGAISSVAPPFLCQRKTWFAGEQEAARNNHVSLHDVGTVQRSVEMRAD